MMRFRICLQYLYEQYRMQFHSSVVIFKWSCVKNTFVVSKLRATSDKCLQSVICRVMVWPDMCNVYTTTSKQCSSSSSRGH